MKATFFEIPLDIFSNSVMVFVNYDGQKLRSVYRRWKTSPEQIKAIDGLARWWDNHSKGEFDFSGCTQSTPDEVVVMLLLKNLEMVNMVVSHEMVHAARRIMSAAAIEHNDSTEEVLAYLVGFLTMKAMRSIERLALPKVRKAKR